MVWKYWKIKNSKNWSRYIEETKLRNLKSISYRRKNLKGKMGAKLDNPLRIINLIVQVTVNPIKNIRANISCVSAVFKVDKRKLNRYSKVTEVDYFEPTNTTIMVVRSIISKKTNIDSRFGVWYEKCWKGWYAFLSNESNSK